MRIPVGQPVRLSTTVKDIAGVLGNAGALTLTILKPDLTTQAYATPTNDGMGLYHQDVPAADLSQIGHYQFKWVSTGTNAGVSSGAFDVVDPFDTELLSLEDAKQALNKSGLGTTDDAEIEVYIAAITRTIEKYIGPVNPRTVTDRRLNAMPDGSVWVRTRPPLDRQLAMLTVTSLTSAGGTVYSPLVADIDAVNGIIYPTSTSYYYGGPYTAVYRVGLSGVPEDISLAARQVLIHLWRTQRGPGAVGGSRVIGASLDEGAIGAEAFAYAKSYGVLEMLNPYRQASVA